MVPKSDQLSISFKIISKALRGDPVTESLGLGLGMPTFKNLPR